MESQYTLTTLAELSRRSTHLYGEPVLSDHPCRTCAPRVVRPFASTCSHQTSKHQTNNMGFTGKRSRDTSSPTKTQEVKRRRAKKRSKSQEDRCFCDELESECCCQRCPCGEINPEGMRHPFCKDSCKTKKLWNNGRIEYSD